MTILAFVISIVVATLITYGFERPLLKNGFTGTAKNIKIKFVKLIGKLPVQRNRIGKEFEA